MQVPVLFNLDSFTIEIKHLFTVIVNVVPVLTHPLAFSTVIVPVYVPAGVPAGTAIDIGLVGKISFVTDVKLFVGAAFQTMLYLIGVPDATLYVNGVICALSLKQTDVAVAVVVITGKGFTVTVTVCELVHELAAILIM